MFILDKNLLLENIEENAELIEELTGYDKKRIKQDRSRRFRKDIEKGIEYTIEILKRSGYLKYDGKLGKKAIKEYISKMIGDLEVEMKGIYEYGKYLSERYGRDEEWFYKKYGLGDKYYEINPKYSIRESIKKKETTFIVEKRREMKGGHYIILLDASGSMYGEKFYEAKKAILFILYKILVNNDRASLIVFNDRILISYEEVENIELILEKIFELFPNGSTDIALALLEAQKMIKGKDHILIITDALPTHGKDPIKKTMEIAKRIKDTGCTISIIGIRLNEKGNEIAKNIVKIGGGRLYIVKDLKDISKFVIMDYLLSKQSK